MLPNFHMSSPRWMRDKPVTIIARERSKVEPPVPMWTCSRCGVATPIEWRQVHACKHFSDPKINCKEKE